MEASIQASEPTAPLAAVPAAPTDPVTGQAAGKTVDAQEQQSQPQQQPQQQSQPLQASQQTAAQAPAQNQQPTQALASQQNFTAQHRPRVMARDRYNHQSLGASLNSSVKQARVLMVGAGGIGCELLKNLALTGFSEIHIVDLDTIDLSNLNRQFLFRQEHIKKSKALVAKEVAEKFNPTVKIVAHHANIKDGNFTVSWFRQFSIVFNALDNLEARRHVNKMCLAADVPLIESGTTGFNGQVQVIKKGVTACYDCTAKETPKTFPVCTIRSTPSQPIHCIVWGKSYLMNEIFGVSEDQSAFDHSEDAKNAHEIEELKKESEALEKIRDAVGTANFPQLLFDKVFNSDIERLRSVEDMWKSRRKPTPLNYETVFNQATDAIASKDDILSDDQRVWTLEENLVVFRDSLDRLSKRMLDLKKNKDPSGPEPTISFDKDDIDALDFVASCANIRSTIFGIDRKSRFDIKEMAGNIIPAIATTNAIVAGLCILEAFKVLKGDYGQAKEVFLQPFAPTRLLGSDTSRKPNPECPVCSAFNVTIKVDLSRATLNDVVEDIIKEQLGLEKKEFVLNNEVGIVYDSDETDNLPKKLSDLGIKGGSFLTVIDEDDDEPLVNIVINIEEGAVETQDKPVEVDFEKHPEIPQKPKKILIAANGDSNGVQRNGKHSDQDAQSRALKRAHPGDDAQSRAFKRAHLGDDAQGGTLKRTHPGDDAQPTKKARVASAEDDVVLVQDDAGAIVIPDD
ncbi:E1 ubiquitin-activating protein uba2 [Metarhizium acridum]|uniref:Putative ubiquitin-activating enzyme UBA2 n=1 Tax=Metarhizium acridum (strain CQMa 102) TaxID=655827 RepID=E9E188_METAQ|nr:putative ubiquitin-activating enzyme UBA2 [Metarhizium acridum CQMa 102]EFY90390.1 putative ubiquitin-activating enzyme UBA2 [Metarhizium acridum CQMa 102]KAG8417627.1 E1 ubiquitin-activating protein uba2 [Metarhizium acridum]